MESESLGKTSKTLFHIFSSPSSPIFLQLPPTHIKKNDKEFCIHSVNIRYLERTFGILLTNVFFVRRYDTRGEDKSFDEARHWSDDKVLTGRAFFRGDHDPGRLILDNVSGKDQGVYKCRVDFRKAPTRISNVNLNVIGKYELTFDWLQCVQDHFLCKEMLISLSILKLHKNP